MWPCGEVGATHHEDLTVEYNGTNEAKPFNCIMLKQQQQQQNYVSVEPCEYYKAEGSSAFNSS